MDVKMISGPLEIHAKEKFRLAKIFDIKFLLHFGFEDKRVLTDDDKVIHMSKNPSGRFAGCIQLEEDTQVR
jgi:hypothetical protein